MNRNRIAARAAACLAFAFTLACGSDSTGPSVPTVTPLSVAFSVTTASSGHQVLRNGAAYYACDFAFSAHATGGAPTDFVVWTDGDINFRLASTGAQYTQSLYGSDLQDWFGSDQLNTGTTESAVRELSWSGPFTATVLLRYFDAGLFSLPGANHTATFNVSC
jgi:hypothetical protein